MPQVAVLLDTPERIVANWCRLRMIPGTVFKDSAWRIPGSGLFFFCGGKIEPRYRTKTAAALLDISPATLEGWIKAGTLKKSKWGVAKSAPVRITESELMRLLSHAD